MDSPEVIIALAVLLTIVIVGGIVVLLVRHKRQRPYSTVLDPEIRMEWIWRDWMEADLEENAARLRREARQKLDAHQMNAVRDDLVAFEKDVLSRPYPLTAIREEMMNSVDRRILNVEILRLPPVEKARIRSRDPEIIQYDSHAQEYIIANELRLYLLREYAARRYGDRAENDWFAVYERAASMKRRLSRSRIRQGIEEDGSEDSPQDSRHQAIDMVDRQLRLRLLQVPPGTSFPDQDKERGERTAGSGNPGSDGPTLS